MIVRSETEKDLRPITFLMVIVLHVVLLLGVVFSVNNAPLIEEKLAGVMKLLDVNEYVPIVQEVYRPPAPETPPLPENAVESIAENVIETEEAPDVTVVAPGSLTEAGGDYLPMSRISVPPVFDERRLRNALVYPAIAQRSGIEGRVYLELYVDREGVVQRVIVLKEDPAEHGFAEAAVKAFQNLRGTPAQANGVAVPVRYRYPVSFRIRN